MGRIFETRKVKMFARWAKTARAFTKIGKEIAIAIKLGSADPDNNSRLRAAIQNAKALNMPKDRVEAAIKRAVSKDQADYHEISYEGYGPHGIAIYVVAATDNPTRTVANVRSIFDRWGGALASAGALNYLFKKRGVFAIPEPKGDLEEFELEMIDHGLEELFKTDDGFMIYTNFSEFGSMQRALEERGLEVKSSSSEMVPNNLVAITPEQEAEVQKLIDSLEEDDDVQHVYHNMQGKADS